MKKLTMIGLAMVVALALGGVASAHMGDADGAGPGCGMGPGMMIGCGPGSDKPVDLQKFKQFQKETATLREDLMLKQQELRNEYLKENPDEDRTSALQKEMIDLRTKIHKAADKAGIELPGRGRCGKRDFDRGMMRGGCGYCDR